MSGFITMYGRRTLLMAPFTPGAEWADLYLGLLTSFPDISDDGDSVVEVPPSRLDPTTGVSTETGYSRAHMPALDSLDQIWTVVGGGTIAYTREVRFPNALSSWGDLVAWGLFTQPTSGEMVAAGDMSAGVNGPAEGEESDEEEPIGDTVVIPPFGATIEIVSYV